MPLEAVRRHTIKTITRVVERELQHSPEPVVLEVPPRRDQGDLAWPGALPLARVLKRAPRQIAETIAGAAEWHHLVQRVEVAGPGFLNVYLDRCGLLRQLLVERGPRPVATPERFIVEHTSINPDKAAHLGHLRHAVLGDILVRCLRHQGHRVEVQSWINDTGVQVADVVVGVLHLPEPELAAALGVETVRRTELIQQLLARVPTGIVPPASVSDFDDLCWEICPLVTARYEQDPDLLDQRAVVLHAIAGGAGELPEDQAVQLLTGAVIAAAPYPPRAVAFLAAAVAEGNLRCHLATMARLGIAYDLLPHESDLLRRGCWQRAFELLRSAAAIRLVAQGKSKGCWVLSLADCPELAGMDDPDQILVRANGTVTYTGKEIAYQLWKLGLLIGDDGGNLDLGARAFARWQQPGPAAPVVYGDTGAVLARTAATAAGQLPEQRLGGADQVFKVIDVRQSYHQKVVREAVRLLGHPAAAARSLHLSSEMVALTPAAVQRLERRTGRSFGPDAEALQQGSVEMPGRRGIGVKADELLDILEDAAGEAIRDRRDGAPAPHDLAQRGQAIAVGALRYRIAHQSHNRVLAFDLDEALALTGATGPSLQCSAVRAAKIFEKLAARRGEGLVGADEVARLTGVELSDDLWSLVLECARRQETVAAAVANLELSLLARHVHLLARQCHKLYHKYPVVAEEDESLRRLRRAVLTVFVREMRVLLEELLGIPVPEER